MSLPKPVVFLDIDGVLNGHEFDRAAMSNRIDHDKVIILNRVLSDSGAFVVLSTAWRYIVHRKEATLDGFDWLLRSHGFMAGRLIGLTDRDTMTMPDSFDGTPGSWPIENERGNQIARWRYLSGHVGPYVVIDDLDLGIRAAGHPFVQTDGKIGITDRDAGEATRILTCKRRGYELA